MNTVRIETPDGIGSADGIIGVVGVAPFSTVEFLKVLYGTALAEKDWHYPRVICDINTKIPSRGRHFELGEADFSPSIKQNITQLIEQGANVIVCTCNTAHIYFDRWGKDHTAAVISIIDATVGELKRLSAIRAGVLAGRSLRNSGVYERAIASAGIDTLDLEDHEASTIYSAILCIKMHGEIADTILGKIESIFKRLKSHNTDSLVLGCTELTPLMPIAARYFSSVVDSNLSLARAAMIASKKFSTIV